MTSNLQFLSVCCKQINAAGRLAFPCLIERSSLTIELVKNLKYRCSNVRAACALSHFFLRCPDSCRSLSFIQNAWCLNDNTSLLISAINTDEVLTGALRCRPAVYEGCTKKHFEVKPVDFFFQTVLRVWDCLFFEGSKVLLRVALCLIKQREETLRTKSGMPDIVASFQNLKQEEKTVDCHSFMKVRCFMSRSPLHCEGAKRRPVTRL